MYKIANWNLNRVDEQGNIITGYEYRANCVTYEQAKKDYLYWLEIQGIPYPLCQCIEVELE